MKLTNHSAKKHMVQKLRDSACSPSDIMQISGQTGSQLMLGFPIVKILISAISKLKQVHLLRKYGEPFASVYGRSRKRHQYVLLPGNDCSAFDYVLLPGIVCSGIYFRARYSSGNYSLLPGMSLLGYIQSTFGLDTARVICTLLSGMIQLEFCYVAEQ
ncbi:hypothetical protein DPMN_076776 [Dreissena polymorpha]|uniref:Uncharacterized protein n=1 Tax=Dreissena polymorpha TaxID=45954 RepID=A0A9D3YMZ2_DREPO|nr:hypothetical protein DPMN_076776 [Dreissena polymorpha]